MITPWNTRLKNRSCFFFKIFIFIFCLHSIFLKMEMGLSFLLFCLNMFFTSRDVEECARNHGDILIHKMPLEQAQIASTVKRVLHERNEYELAKKEGRITLVEQKKGRKTIVKEVIVGEKIIPDDNIIYKSKKSAAHRKHPVQQWACLSLRHYNWVVDLGIALLEERVKRIAFINSEEFPRHIFKEKKKKLPCWNPEHKSMQVLLHLKNNPPPLEWFAFGDSWIDPPKCVSPTNFF